MSQPGTKMSDAAPAAVDLDGLIDFYQTLRPETIPGFARFYAEDAYFRDPFNEVRGLMAIERIFTHLFRQVGEPRFVVLERVADAGGACLIWEFYYRVRLWGRGETQVMRGATHLRFAADGRVAWHRDYWDAAEELYAHLPAVGPLMRGLKRLLAA